MLIFISCISSFGLYAQNDSIWRQKPKLKISGFIDFFYVFDFNQPQKTKRQAFLFNHNRHNALNVNLGFVKLNLDQQKYRANVALQVGTYSVDNYSAEPGILKNIFEANIGLSINKKNNLWIDAGVFSSHIGFESAISADNWTMTRSLLAENSPYFLSGAKMTYNPNQKLEIAILIINGWQRIQQLKGNTLPSLGTKISFTPSNKVTLNWSTFIGSDDPDSTRRMRYFSNLYGQFQLSKKFGLIAGFDAGLQQQLINSSIYDRWFSPIILAQFTINKKFKTAIRTEYYQDKTGIIIPTSTLNGFQTIGISLNIDHAPTQNIIWRTELRWLKSKDQIFETKAAFTNNNFIIATSITKRFLRENKKT